MHQSSITIDKNGRFVVEQTEETTEDRHEQTFSFVSTNQSSLYVLLGHRQDGSKLTLASPSLRIAARLERFSLNLIEAFNVRDFCIVPSASTEQHNPMGYFPPYGEVARSCAIYTNYPIYHVGPGKLQVREMPRAIELPCDHGIDLERALTHWKLIAELFPAARITVLSSHASIDEKKRSATVIMDLRIEDCPPGSVFHSVAIKEWKKIMGSWKCV